MIHEIMASTVRITCKGRGRDILTCEGRGTRTSAILPVGYTSCPSTQARWLRTTFGDYKLTVNPVANTDTYRLPRREDLFASLSGGKVFSKLDITQAYLQIPVDEKSKNYTTLNTHKGLFQFTRLPFSAASASSIFQRIKEGILQGIPGVCVYLTTSLSRGKTYKNTTEIWKPFSLVWKRPDSASNEPNATSCCLLLNLGLQNQRRRPTPDIRENLGHPTGFPATRY